MDDQNPGLEGTGEQLEELELEPTSEEKTEQGGDPLDDIQDVTARAEAKRVRAIQRRQDRKPPEKKVETPVTAPELPDESKFVTKADFYKSNEKAAVKQAIADPEVKANWNKITPFFASRRGKETVDDILEDIKDAITLYKVRNPVVETDDSAKVLTETPVVKPGGGPTKETTPKVANPPNFHLPVQPKEWYPKKEAKS